MYLVSFDLSLCYTFFLHISLLNKGVLCGLYVAICCRWKDGLLGRRNHKNILMFLVISYFEIVFWIFIHPLYSIIPCVSRNFFCFENTIQLEKKQNLLFCLLLSFWGNWFLILTLAITVRPVFYF